MTEKLPLLTFVSIIDAANRKTRCAGMEAIVEEVYSHVISGQDVHCYSLYVIEKGAIIATTDWYMEDQLIGLKNQDKDKAEKMIDQYIKAASEPENCY